MRPLPVFHLIAAAVAASALVACSTAPAPRQIEPVAPVVRPATVAKVCTTCGRIERIDVATTGSGSKPSGAVLGGVVGGVLAKPAPVAASTGVAAPSVNRTYRIVVLLESGRRLILTQPLQAGMKVGARVRVDRSRAVLLR